MREAAGDCGKRVLEFCRHHDAAEFDPLSLWRDEFHIPLCSDLPDVGGDGDGSRCMYFGGHSLGLVSKRSEKEIGRAVAKWRTLGLATHFVGRMRSLDCDEEITPSMAKVVGAKPCEVAIMNSLTVNIHVLLAAFFRPQGARRKILIEDMAFPSDHYAVESQLRLHGLDVGECLLLARPREGEACVRTRDVVRLIDEHADSLCVVWLPGVQYLTGQLFDVAAITAAAHAHGVYAGWDLAHAVANVPLALHDWQVDFAAWCTYKYLNAGPGSIGGVFVHERLAVPASLHGWWGHRLETRFDMTNKMELSDGVLGYRISNPSLLHCASLKGSLDVLEEAGMGVVRGRAVELTRWLEALLDHHLATSDLLSVVTPRDVAQRGAQLSLRINLHRLDLAHLYSELKRRGAVVDKRMPDVIRVSVAPLFVSHADVARFLLALLGACHALGAL